MRKLDDDADNRADSWLAKLGPGLITGAADDDPSGIATYSQAGAKFGFHSLWTMLLSYPLMVAIQIICARIGRVSGHGLATNMRRHYPMPLLYSVVVLLLLANTINIAADLSAMGDALALLIGGPKHWYAAGFGVLSLLLQAFLPYTRYVRILKWLTLALLTYVAIVFTVHIPWSQVGMSLIFPRLEWSADYLMMIVAILGTTISPYLFFWQSSEEVEHLLADEKAEPIKYAPEQARSEFKRISSDTLIGMGFSNLVAFFIILTTAITLHGHGATSIETSAQAAEALRPVAGSFAFFLFGMGIIGTGLLAVPVLAGSAAYAIAGTFRWRNSLELSPALAKKFYGIVALATLGGVAIDFTELDPIKALYWSAVVNGVISVPMMVIAMMLATNTKVMGKYTVTGKLKWLGWTATILMALAVSAMFLSSLLR